jgi:M6 family metalloprotease-like protein
MKRLLFVSILSVVIFMDNAFSSNEVCRTTGSATSTQHVTGIVTLKILLVEFSDVKHRTSPSAYTKTDFENLFFSSGIYVSPHMYSPNNESVYGSMNDYYQKMSNGNLSITGHIVNTVQNNIPIWLNFPNTKAYCDTDNNFMYDVINTATAQGLDVGNLGNLTKLVIIYAGNVYWGGYLNPMAISIPGNFYIMSERNGGPTNPNGEHSTDVFSRIGVHCHEFGHCIGINHSSGSRADIMEAGYRNGPNYDGYNGAAPAPFNPIARWSMGWLTDTIISGDQQKNAYYSLTAPQVFQINSNSNGDYFLTENRRFDQTMVIGTTTVPDYNNAAWMPIGQTQNTPNTNIQEGILVWRVRGGMALDYNSNGLIYASGRYGASYPDNHPSQTDAGDVFPGTAGTTILSPYSDSRDPGNTEGNHYTLYVPNTKGGTNVGMEVLSENTTGGYFTLRLHSAQQVLPSTISSSQTLNGEYISTRSHLKNTFVKG